MKRMILVLVAALAVIFVMYFAVRPKANNNNTYPVYISVSGFEDEYSVLDATNNKDLGTFDTNSATLRLAAGTYRLVFSSGALDSVTVQVVLTSSESKEVVVGFSAKKTASETLESVAGDGASAKTTKAKYFANDSWLVGNVSSTSDDIDTSIVVSKIQNGEWVTVASGTFIDIELLSEYGAPKELIDYVENTQ